jgi:hypothetical protein
MRPHIPFILVAALFATAPLVAQEGQPADKGKPPENKPAYDMQKPDQAKPTHDQEVVKKFFSNYPDGLPPGLAKKENLPPGLDKQLLANAQLPPGLEKEIQPLPRDLESQLTPLGASAKRGYIAGKVVTWDTASRSIREVLKAHD